VRGRDTCSARRLIAVLSLAATINVRDPGGVVGALIGWAIPDGQYPITVVVNDFAVRIDAHLSRRSRTPDRSGCASCRGPDAWTCTARPLTT
jgi:hypothetical protein